MLIWALRWTKLKRKDMIRNIKLFKTKLRAKFRAYRESLDKNKKQLMDEKILKKILFLSAYKLSGVIFTYVSKDIEVDTYKLMEKCWEDGKKVAVPKCVTKNKSMHFYIINSFGDLEKSTFGLLEPVVSKCERVTDFSQGLCIVPGFCFDAEGFRLGYGYGYYDRFLQKFKGSTLGICYSESIVTKLPHGRFDRPVDILLTDGYIKEVNHLNRFSKRGC